MRATSSAGTTPKNSSAAPKTLSAKVGDDLGEREVAGDEADGDDDDGVCGEERRRALLHLGELRPLAVAVHVAGDVVVPEGVVPEPSAEHLVGDADVGARRRVAALLLGALVRVPPPHGDGEHGRDDDEGAHDHLRVPVLVPVEQLLRPGRSVHPLHDERNVFVVRVSKG